MQITALPSPSPEPNELINLCTPPGSPSTLTFEDLPSSDHPRNPYPLGQGEIGGSRLSPQKRARDYRSQLKRNTKRRLKQTQDLDLLTLPDTHDDASVAGINQGPADIGSIDDCQPQPHEDSGEDVEFPYIDAVFSEAVGFYQIGPTLFVVQGWDARTESGTRSWYHLQSVLIGHEVSSACFCPKGMDHRCVHLRFLADYGDVQFPPDNVFSSTNSDCILFSRQRNDNSIVNMFSIAFPGYTSVKSRAVVRHEGDDEGMGTWSCSKDKDANALCGHITQARHHLQQLLQQDPGAQDANSANTSGALEAPVRVATLQQPAISHRPILPPAWATLPGDHELYPRPPAMLSPPNVIPLDMAAQGSCTCGARCAIDGKRITRPCTVYTLSRSYESRIELQICARCSSRYHQFIGGDLRELGLFNYNNRILMTHDLLDDYTASYTSSETPFVAWAGVVARRYQRHASPKKFIPDSVFRAAWFAYSRLQWLVDDMQCPKCGPTPEDTIWDGVTLAFSKKHLLPSLRPLTTVDEKSPRHNSQYVQDQAMLVSKKLHRSVRRIIVGPSLWVPPRTKPSPSAIEGDSGNDTDDENIGKSAGTGVITKAEAKAVAEHCERINLIPETCAQLSAINHDLGKLFDTSFHQDFNTFPY